jgi:hypothetical protein
MLIRLQKNMVDMYIPTVRLPGRFRQSQVGELPPHYRLYSIPLYMICVRRIMAIARDGRIDGLSCVSLQ